MSTSETHIEAEIWIAYDQDGNTIVGTDSDDLEDAWAENIGGYYWLRCLKVSIPKPVIPSQSVTLPDDPNVELIQIEE